MIYLFQKDATTLKRLYGSTTLSLALHVGLLCFGFIAIPWMHHKIKDVPMEVILINSQTQGIDIKDKNNLLAQTNHQGGGNQSQNFRASSPLPNLNENVNGTDLDLKERQQLSALEEQIVQLEQVQSDLLKKMHDNLKKLDPQSPTTALLKREAAMIDEKIQDYQQRPRKAFVGPTTKQYPMAQYIEEWRTKIEEYGNKHYPDNLKGRFYGQVVISVNIRHDGKLLDITIDESSNNPEIDKAAVALIRKNAPFASFSRKLADELVIPRTWRFTRNGLLSEDINSRLTVAP